MSHWSLMTSRALIVPTIVVQPNPPPYGALRMSKGAWDQLQARKAYQDTSSDRTIPPQRQSALDLKI
jgi:hypothetical protein